MHTVKCLMKSHRLLKKTAHAKTSHYFVLPIERAHQTEKPMLLKHSGGGGSTSGNISATELIFSIL